MQIFPQNRACFCSTQAMMQVRIRFAGMRKNGRPKAPDKHDGRIAIVGELRFIIGVANDRRLKLCDFLTGR
jgi:hypothetical protein